MAPESRCANTSSFDRIGPGSDSRVDNTKFEKLSESALRELGGATGFVQTDLLTFDFASIAGHEAGFAQLGLQRLIVYPGG
jgi:hypothetical protein